MVQTELKLDPHSGVTLFFRSKRGDRLKREPTRLSGLPANIHAALGRAFLKGRFFQRPHPKSF